MCYDALQDLTITYVLSGPSFWDQGILTFLGVQDSSLVQQFSPRNLPLNECFLLFGAFGCFLNILQASVCLHQCCVSLALWLTLAHPFEMNLLWRLCRYRHVVKKRLASKQDPITPLFGLYPFVVHAGCNVAWLYYAPGIMGSGHLVAFCLYWGLAFAYQVGLLITAYTTKQSFPYFNLMMIVSALGAADAREGFKGSHYAFQTSTDNQIMAMYIALGVSFVVYAVFVRDVIGSVSFLVVLLGLLTRCIWRALRVCVLCTTDLRVLGHQLFDCEAQSGQQEKLIRGPCLFRVGESSVPVD